MPTTTPTTFRSNSTIFTNNPQLIKEYGGKPITLSPQQLNALHNCPQTIRENKKTLALCTLSNEKLQQKAMQTIKQYCAEDKNFKDPYHLNIKHFQKEATKNPAKFLEKAGVIETDQDPRESTLANYFKTKFENLTNTIAANI